jgi:hypothetical protein
VKAFTVRRINESDLEDFRRVRLEALLLHPDAFGASYEDWSQKPAPFFAEKLRTIMFSVDLTFTTPYRA